MIYPGDIPYLKTMMRKVSLNRGTPIGKGNLVFLFSKNINRSIRMMNQTDNLYSNGYMHFYFYPPKYRGYIKNRRYFINDMTLRKEINKKIRENTNILPYPMKPLINSDEKRNTYYDLCRYYSIYTRLTQKENQVYRTIAGFWQMFTPILSDSYGQLTNKLVLINANDYPMETGSLRTRIKNPLYLLYMTLYKKFELIETLDIDFIIYAGNRVLKVNPSKCDKKSYLRFMVELKKIYRNVTIDDASEDEIVEAEKELSKSPEEDVPVETHPLPIRPVVKVTAVGAASQPKVIKATIKPGKDTKQLVENLKELNDPEFEKAITEKIEVTKEEVTKKVTKSKAMADDMDDDEDSPYKKKEEEDTSAEIEEEVEREINEDKEMMENIYRKVTDGTTPKSQRSTARDEALRKDQENIMVKGMTVRELAKINPKERKIEKTEVKNAMATTNPNMKEIAFNNFNQSYTDNVMTKDIVGVFESLNDKSTKMFIRDIKVEDTSDVLNYKETWTVSLEDENRTRHTIKVDMPKFIDKNFLWIGGNKKVIKNQMFFLPLVKISNDTVMLVTNYNKMSIKRVDGRSLREVTLIEKIFESSKLMQEHFVTGSASVDNREFITGVEYDEYAKNYISYSSGKLKLYFNQKEATEIAKKKEITIPEKSFFIGFSGKDPIFIQMNTQRDQNNKSISDHIIESLDEEDASTFTSLQMKVPKRLMYTKVTTMKQDVPIGVLICLWEGLTKLLAKGNIEYRLVDRVKSSDIASNEDFLRFKNCYLIYKTSIPVELLMNGLKVLNTKDYDISEMDGPGPYVPYMEKKYGKISILNALNNVYEFTIGNIEKEILRDMKLPTDLVSLMVYANNLLADNQYISELDMSEYRIRCAEILPAILYDCIAKAYVPYKNSNGKKKLSIPQDAVIKKLVALQTVEDCSTLNPFLELETTHGVSTKGWRGVNLEESYTVPKRSYDKSMTGIIGVSSSPDAQVGVNRTLTMEPSINSVRGYLDIKSDNLDQLKDVNLFSPAEMLIPLGATRDDPIRTGHSVKQSRASVPVKNASPVLISNGSDELCKYYLSSDFVVMAEKDGKVIDYDEDAKIMIVEYKDGTHRAINLDKNIVKNGGGGFELSNVLVTDLKVGDTFKANDTLAWHKDFFKKIPGQGVRMCVGALIKVALYSCYNTYEDGDFITEKVSHMCETEMVFRIKANIGRNSNVFNMVSVGDEVAVGDPLIEFDESFEEADINELLASLGDNEELKEAVIQNNRNTKKTDKSGIIEDIKIYSASDLEDLSPSLRKIVSKYYKRIDKKTAILNKYDKTNSIVKCGMMITESSGTTTPDRYGNIRGEKVNDGVLIEFYVKHSEPLEVGSKVANFSPLKNVVGEVIPKGYEPTSEFRPEESVDTTINPSSILNRMVSSVTPTILGNKCIIELKRSLADIWNKAGEFEKKRAKMESLIYKFFSTLDKTGDNTKKYKAMFKPMSDTKFKSFFKEFFSNEYHYLILDMVDYERTIQIEDIEDAAKVLGIPLYEYVAFPHINMDKDHPIVTPHPVPVGYLHIKRPQQTVMKKNGMSTAINQRSAITNQVMGKDKNGRESDLENCMLTSLGMEHTLKELNGPRADDSVAKKEMLQAIATKGYVTEAELTDDVRNKTTLNTVDTYFLGMGLKTDLVSKGLKLPSELNKE